MKPLKQKHNLARLRTYLNLRQKEMGALVGYSMRTIQSVENRTLTLSEPLARRISVATGIDWDWLLENDLKAPLKADNFKPFTKKYYHRRRSERERGLITPTYWRELRTMAFYSWMRAIFATQDGGVALFETGKFLERLARRYGYNRSIIPAPRLEAAALQDFKVLRQHADIGVRFIAEKYKNVLESEGVWRLVFSIPQTDIPRHLRKRKSAR
jgi:transcriptional regulator with XRE-family HTH domain